MMDAQERLEFPGSLGEIGEVQKIEGSRVLIAPRLDEVLSRLKDLTTLFPKTKLTINPSQRRRASTWCVERQSQQMTKLQILAVSDHLPEVRERASGKYLSFPDSTFVVFIGGRDTGEKEVLVNTTLDTEKVQEIIRNQLGNLPEGWRLWQRD